jgi:hypothetical protein
MQQRKNTTKSCVNNLHLQVKVIHLRFLTHTRKLQHVTVFVSLDSSMQVSANIITARGRERTVSCHLTGRSQSADMKAHY